MYGLVNKAVQDLVVEKFGEEVWEYVKQEAGVEEEMFISNRGYPDEITYKLAGGVSKITGLTSTQVMHALGEFWVLETGAQGYGDLLKDCGGSIPEFLRNLGNLHARVKLMFPDLKPPHFEVLEEEPGELKLLYSSNRRGLEDFVVGLIQGIGKLLEIPTTCELISELDPGVDDRHFRVKWAA